MLRHTAVDDETTLGFSRDNSVFAVLLQSIMNYISLRVKHYILLIKPDADIVTLLADKSAFAIPAPASALTPVVCEALSKALAQHGLRNLLNEPWCDDDTSCIVVIWIGTHTCLEDSTLAPACECPFVYFFVKYCLDQGLGVSKLALALYDRMNMQLSREFIRCTNPTCELNKLDKSTGKTKFKQCSRCKAVIYCSRECQVAHFPEHKRLCREHLADWEKS